MAGRDPESQTVSLIMDASTANTVMFAVAADADECEAHVREVEQFGESLPEELLRPTHPPGHAARETRVAARLRAVERAYRIASERDSALKPPEPTAATSSPKPPADREIELE